VDQANDYYLDNQSVVDTSSDISYHNDGNRAAAGQPLNCLGENVSIGYGTVTTYRRGLLIAVEQTTSGGYCQELQKN
jgi:hypothetical protein